MAFIKPAVKLIIREHSRYNFHGPALALGVPEIYATYREVQAWLPSLANKPCLLPPHDVKISTNPHGSKLGWITIHNFLQALGIDKITSIDIPGCEHAPDLVHDLNHPLPPEMLNRFNLILDPGTIEHVFDHKTCFTNIVSALKIGGVIVHLVPTYSYNGGYFSINPNVLHDYYRVNGFEEIKAYIIMWDLYRPYSGQCRCYPYSDELLGARHALTDYDQCRYSPELLFFARKRSELATPVTPIQSYEFIELFESRRKQTAPPIDVSERANTRWRRLYNLGRTRGWSYLSRYLADRIFQVSRVLGMLPFGLLYYYETAIRRKRQLRRIHQHSFKI